MDCHLASVQVWGPALASKIVPEAGRRVPNHCNGNDTGIARRIVGLAMATHHRGVSGRAVSQMLSRRPAGTTSVS